MSKRPSTVVCKPLPEDHIWPSSFWVHPKAKDDTFILNGGGKVVLTFDNCMKFNFAVINQVALESSHTVKLCSILADYWAMGYESPEVAAGSL